MRIVFFGTPELSVPALATVARRHELTALVCQPDKPKGRSKTPQPPPAKEWALAHGIEVYQPERLNAGAFEAWLRGQAPDVCCLFAYGRILKQAILDIPEHGFLNVHPSLLPRHRGMSPIQTPIMQGDSVTGVTIMRMDAGMDTGDILLQRETPIRPDDTAVTLGERLARMAAHLLLKALDLVEAGEAEYTPQDENLATYTHRIERETGYIGWDQPARAIHDLVRAMQPWPVAQCRLEGEVCKIHETALTNEPAMAPPGTVVRIEDGRALVAARDKLLGITRFQAPGRKAMPMADFLRGHPLEPGDRFEDMTR